MLFLCLKNAGRLTVAHSMGLKRLEAHHQNVPSSVSRSMLTGEELSLLMSPWYQVDTKISDEDKYIVSGVRL